MSDYVVAAPLPPDGRLQVWYFDPTFTTLLTRWKANANPDSPWTAPAAPFIPPPPGSFFDMAAGNLPDGRTQIWGVGFFSGNYKVYTTWKLSTVHDSLWHGWDEFDTSPMAPMTNPPIGISVAALPDKRLQLFIVDPNLVIWTAWKTSTDPSSPWNSLRKL